MNQVKITASNFVVDEENYVPIDTDTTAVRAATETIHSNQTSIELMVKPYFGETATTLHTHEVRFGTININPSYYNDPSFVGGIKTLDSYESYYQLDPSQQDTIKDVYYNVFERDPNDGKINLGISVLRSIIPSFKYTKLFKRKLQSFSYSYIPQSVISGIRNLVSVELDAFYASMGSHSLIAFKLMNRESIASLFVYFGETKILNSFVNTSGELISDPNSLTDLLGMGVSIDIFKGLTAPVSIDGFIYSQDKSNINLSFISENINVNFVRPFFATNVALHPTAPGQLLNAFKLLSNVSVVGGYAYQGYNLSGFTYNGTDIDFS